MEEIRKGRVIGPFPKGSVSPPAHISRFGVIPKSSQPDKWRLIIDLSHPCKRSVNDGIPKHLCSMSYITIDNAIERILAHGPGTMLAKIDICSAFRLMPVHPADRHLLAMEWEGQVYIDACLPFGLRSAPKLFNTLAKGLHACCYLDDFLTMGPPGSHECSRNLETLKQVCHLLGIPLALEKVLGPATLLDFLGIILDTTRMEARLPEDKLKRTQSIIQEWLGKKNAKKREILSLVGVLQHAAKVVRPGRTFVSRMYITAAKVSELDHFTCLNKEFRSDLYWWHISV